MTSLSSFVGARFAEVDRVWVGEREETSEALKFFLADYIFVTDVVLVHLGKLLFQQFCCFLLGISTLLLLFNFFVWVRWQNFVHLGNTFLFEIWLNLYIGAMFIFLVFQILEGRLFDALWWCVDLLGNWRLLKPLLHFGFIDFGGLVDIFFVSEWLIKRSWIL